MFWKIFKKKQPKKDGWYQCTVEVPGQQRYVMDLYWYGNVQRFRDNRRQTVFDYYHVFGYNDETGKNDKRMYTEDICDRTVDVIAWRKVPKPYMKGFIKEEL